MNEDDNVKTEIHPDWHYAIPLNTIEHVNLKLAWDYAMALDAQKNLEQAIAVLEKAKKKSIYGGHNFGVGHYGKAISVLEKEANKYKKKAASIKKKEKKIIKLAEYK